MKTHRERDRELQERLQKVSTKEEELEIRFEIYRNLLAWVQELMARKVRRRD